MRLRRTWASGVEVLPCMARRMAVGTPVGAATSSWRRAPPTSMVCGATGTRSHCSPGAVGGGPPVDLPI